MGDYCAEDCGAVVGCDGADYDAICSWRLVVIVRTGFEDRELEVRLLGVLERELLVVWEGVRLYEIGFGPDGSKYHCRHADTCHDPESVLEMRGSMLVCKQH
jgi:hypothetical protein